MTSPPEMAVGPWSLYGGSFIKFEMWVLLTARRLRKLEGWALKPQVNHTGRMTVVAPADRP